METPEVAEKPVDTEEKLTLKKIDATEVKKAQLMELASKYKNLVITEETLDEADKARLSLYRERIDLQRLETHNNNVLNKAKKKNKDLAEELILLIEPTEKIIMAGIQKVKDMVEKRKEEEEKKERERIAKHKESINQIEEELRLVRVTNDESVLDKIALEVSAQENKFEEFNEEGNAMIKTVLTSIENRKLFLQEEAKAKEIKAKADLEAKALEETKQPNVDPHDENLVAKEDIHTPNTAGVNFKQPATLNEAFPPPVYERPNKFAPLSTPKGKPPVEDPKSKSDFSMNKFTYGGHDFGISVELPEEAAQKIKECIIEIVDDLPID